jgi:hypothetical protein
VIWPSLVESWGATAAERAHEFACDRVLAHADHAMFRAVNVGAPAEVTFRWLCQLRAAPYSYDRLDNRGRRSPQTLTEGLDQLASGQRFQTVFELDEFEPGRSLTMSLTSSIFGSVACTYRADPLSSERSRIVVKIRVAYPRRSLRGAIARLVLPPGDLVMMRRQLLNLAALAERTNRERPPATPDSTLRR